MPIHKLSIQLANQIAAGEVVERPASVVKELVENSIDAGADRISLELTAAGRVGIVVRDNGAGIPRDELELALEPHATSKIATLDDLEAICTMGFRGEALASIAAVSKLTLTSKPHDQERAYMVHTEGPQMTPVVEPAAHPDGTSVEVRELFFNTPARRRFLRSDKSELARIRDIMLRLAMAHHQISFEMLHEGRRLFSAPAVPAGDSSAQFKRLSRLAGSEFAHEGLPLEVKNGSFEVSGLVLPPAPRSAASPESIYLYLNNRPVADKMLIHALREAYSEISGGRSSVRAVLFLKCDPREVDVNVHPRKDEVRFHSARMVHDILVDALVHRMSAVGELFPEGNSAFKLSSLQQGNAEGAGAGIGSGAAAGEEAAAPAEPALSAGQIDAFNRRDQGGADLTAEQRRAAAARAVQSLWQSGGTGAGIAGGQLQAGSAAGAAGDSAASTAAAEDTSLSSSAAAGGDLSASGEDLSAASAGAQPAGSADLFASAHDPAASASDAAAPDSAVAPAGEASSSVSAASFSSSGAGTGTVPGSEGTAAAAESAADPDPAGSAAGESAAGSSSASASAAGEVQAAPDGAALAEAARDFVQQTDPDAIARALGGTAALDARRAEIFQRSLLQENARAALAVQTVEIAGPDFNAAALLDLPRPEIALVKIEGRYFLLRCAALQQYLAARQVLQKTAAGALRPWRLTLPFILRCDPALVRALKTCPQEIERLGFEFKLKRGSIEVLQIPEIMKGAELASSLDRVLHLLASGARALAQGSCPRQLAAALCAHLGRPRAFGRSEAAALCAKIKDAAELAALDGCSEMLIGQWAAQLCGLPG